jgi:hypothetical protein
LVAQHAKTKPPAVATPRALNALAIAHNDDGPLAFTCSITGSTLAAKRSAFALLEAMPRKTRIVSNSSYASVRPVTTPTGRLLSTLLAAIAEFERELIRERTGEGRKRAKSRGVRFGRPSVLTPHQRTEVLARLAGKAIAARTSPGPTTWIGAQ